jgi:hypothetical protein
VTTRVFCRAQKSRAVRHDTIQFDLNGNQCNEFNRDICTLISTRTRYPTEAERQIIAQKIVAKYPFQKDPKIGSTSTEWVRLSVQINMVLYNMFIQYCKNVNHLGWAILSVWKIEEIKYLTFPAKMTTQKLLCTHTAEKFPVDYRSQQSVSKLCIVNYISCYE